MIPNPSIDTAVRILNEAFEADPRAIHSLMCVQIPCNDSLAEHPHVIVRIDQALPTESYVITLLGLINGIVEPMTGSLIAAKWDYVTTPPTLKGFQVYEDDPEGNSL